MVFIGFQEIDPTTNQIGQKMKTAHTPTPWAISSVEDGGLSIVPKETPPHLTICLLPSAPYIERDLANAAFIVRAVNSHDELVTLAGQIILAHEQGECVLPADIIRGAYDALKLAQDEAS